MSITWSYGITTVPQRIDNLLIQTVESLAKSGFDNPTLFIDGICDCKLDHLRQVVYKQQQGHLQNWIQAITHLYVNAPKADYFAIFEDDLIACKNLRSYLEACRYPEKGYWNLLTHDCNLSHTNNGQKGWHKSNQRGKGAVGLVFSKLAVMDLLQSSTFWKRRSKDNLLQAADGVVMDALKVAGYDEYIHYPSLVQHQGFVSAIGPGHRYGEVLGFESVDYDPLIDMPRPLEIHLGKPKDANKNPVIQNRLRLQQLRNLANRKGRGLRIAQRLEEEAATSEEAALRRMVPPSQKRPTVWRGGVLQIHVTRACDMACFGCTQGSNLGGKPVMITVEDFEKACQSLEGYWGIVGMFGGNPAIHPKFEELCEIFTKYFPFEQRGLWSNNPLGKGKIMARTFNPAVSNLNVHLSQAAYDEFKRDWPASNPVGLEEDSRHSPPFVALKDVITDERKRWEMISNCDINKFWSAMVCSIPSKGLRGFFCEIAGAQAMLHANDPNWPDTGIPAEPGWWRRPMQDFADQVRVHCHSCGVPLRRYGQLAMTGEYEEVSDTHKDIYQPKDRNREVHLVQMDDGKHLNRMTDYIQNSVV